MPTIRRPNGQLVVVPCDQCIKEGAAAAAGLLDQPWLEICPRCGHYINPGQPCLVCQMGTIGRVLSGSPDGHYVSVYGKES